MTLFPRTRLPVDDAVLDRQRVVEAFRQRVVDDATGLSDPPYTRNDRSAPASRFWLGVLAPEREVAKKLGETGERENSTERYRPVSQGFSFKVDSLPCSLEIGVSFAVWIAVHPTFREQLRRAGLDETEENPGDPSCETPEGDRKTELARVRMKVPVGPVRIRANLGAPSTTNLQLLHFGRDELSDALNRALSGLPEGTLAYRPLRSSGRLPRDSDLTNENAWETWERSSLSSPVLPSWRVGVDVENRFFGEEGTEILVTLVNRSPEQSPQSDGKDKKRPATTWVYDSNIYEAELEVHPSVPVRPYRLEQIPDTYRYDRTVAALGWNSAVEETLDEETPDNGFRTAFAAIARTERVFARGEARGNKIDTSFATLERDPLPALDRLVQEAAHWAARAWSDEHLDLLARQFAWDNRMSDRARRDRKEVEEEVAWVQAGIEALRDDPSLLQAFKLMNRVMIKAAKGRYDSWRPFQIGFILGCLPSIVYPDRNRTVDILWFPTGGGKTESYLGLNVLALFYERLKGRTGGCQTWARFPLRLLSLQQTQRFAESVLFAETVRREYKPLKGGEPFGVGYLVGAGNTPNKIELPETRYYGGWDPENSKNAESCRVIEFCPVCGKRPEVCFNRDSHTMEHRCVTSGCTLEGHLPVYVIDDDIYRRAPAVLVGTVDKLTQISWNKGFRHFFGKAYGRCPAHGLSSKAGSCSVYPCKQPLEQIPNTFGGLRLEIQDEMHLLAESLGALDGNYETLFHTIAEENGLPPVKIIGATATIEGYREQSYHLYQREPRRFPLPGPRKPESFWAFENPGDPLRTYVALLPRGTTMLNAAYQVAASYDRFRKEALDNPVPFCKAVGIDPEKAAGTMRDIEDLYSVFTTYALRKQELTRYRRDITSNPDLCPEQEWAEITGDVDFWNVRDVLARLEDRTAEKPVRVLGATSAISHGVDIDRLNAMCVMGMPNQASEFIQATARVGRTHPGTVFCLINPMRERDVSHFRYFRKWAEYLDRLVERVPVNRESLPVLDVVLPGGFMAWLLQIDEPQWLEGETKQKKRERLWSASGTARAIEEEFLEKNTIVQRLLRSFSIDPSDSRFARHDDAIGKFVEKAFRELRLANGEKSSVPDTLGRMGRPVPRSLRDVETTIPIRGDK